MVTRFVIHGERGGIQSITSTLTFCCSLRQIYFSDSYAQTIDCAPHQHCGDLRRWKPVNL